VIHSGIGVTYEDINVFSVERINGDPDAGGDEQFPGRD